MARDPHKMMLAIQNRPALGVAGGEPASVSAIAVTMMTSRVGTHGDISRL